MRHASCLSTAILILVRGVAYCFFACLATISCCRLSPMRCFRNQCSHCCFLPVYLASNAISLPDQTVTHINTAWATIASKVAGTSLEVRSTGLRSTRDLHCVIVDVRNCFLCLTLVPVALIVVSVYLRSLCVSLQPTSDSISLSQLRSLPRCNDPSAACGVCLLEVLPETEVKRSSLGGNTDLTKLFEASAVHFEPNTARLQFGKRWYHATCANFWCNCVERTLPNIPLLNDLL